MAEFFFAIKCLFVTAIILVGMQVRVEGVTVESHAQKWIANSKIAQSLQKVAAGGALAVRNVYDSTSDYFSKVIRPEDVQKATKFNLEFKRSNQVDKQKQEN